MLLRSSWCCATFFRRIQNTPRKQVKLTTYEVLWRCIHSHKHKLRCIDMSELCGSVVCVAKGMGADAFVISPAADRRCYDVHPYQIKLEAYEKYFTLGVLSTQRSKSGNSARDQTLLAGGMGCMPTDATSCVPPALRFGSQKLRYCPTNGWMQRRCLVHTCWCALDSASSKSGRVSHAL